jgi:cell division septum initiation protein DivIVA
LGQRPRRASRLLLAKIAALEAENAELKARVEEMERQGKGKTPRNSSPSPSTQHPHARPRPP